MSKYGYKIIIGINVLTLTAAVVSFALIRSAIAQTATSTEQVAETIVEPSASTTISEVTAAAPAVDLREVRIIGTKYTDYFSDGTSLVAFPGDAEIHASIAKPNALAPVREGFVWDHSNGTYLYDTSSGDLEVGTFALQPNGSYIAYLATTTIENATSTPFLPARIVVMREHPVTGALASPHGEVLSATAENVPAERAGATTSSATATEETAAPTDSLSVRENSTTTNETVSATQENSEVSTTTVSETDSASSSQSLEEVGQVLGASAEENRVSESDISAMTTTSVPEEQ